MSGTIALKRTPPHAPASIQRVPQLRPRQLTRPDSPNPGPNSPPTLTCLDLFPWPPDRAHCDGEGRNLWLDCAGRGGEERTRRRGGARGPKWGRMGRGSYSSSTTRASPTPSGAACVSATFSGRQALKGGKELKVGKHDRAAKRESRRSRVPWLRLQVEVCLPVAPKREPGVT